MTKLKWFFAAGFILMSGLSTWAALDQNVYQGLLYLLENRWGVATLADTYFCFLMVYLWIAYKETKWSQRLLWLGLGATLGSIALCLYGLIEIAKLPKNASIEDFLLRRKRELS